MRCISELQPKQGMVYGIVMSESGEPGTVELED